MPHQMDVTVLYLTVVIFHSSGLPVTVNQIIGKSITDSNLSNFLLIRFLATDPMYITYNNSVAARYLT